MALIILIPSHSHHSHSNNSVSFFWLIHWTRLVITFCLCISNLTAFRTLVCSNLYIRDKQVCFHWSSTNMQLGVQGCFGIVHSPSPVCVVKAFQSSSCGHEGCSGVCHPNSPQPHAHWLSAFLTRSGFLVVPLQSLMALLAQNYLSHPELNRLNSLHVCMTQTEFNSWSPSILYASLDYEK